MYDSNFRWSDSDAKLLNQDKFRSIDNAIIRTQFYVNFEIKDLSDCCYFLMFSLVKGIKLFL